MIDLLNRAAVNLDIRQLGALEVQENLTWNVDLDRVDLGVDEGMGNDDPGLINYLIRGPQLEQLPCVPVCLFR